MRFFDLLRTSLTNLYQRKARTLLTILGVIIGTMSIVLMIALGEGSAEVFMEQISQSTDLTKIEVYAGYNAGSKKETGFDDKTVASFEELPGVRSVLPKIDISLYLKSARYCAEVYVAAVPFDKLKLLSDKIGWGTIVKSRDVDMVLGANLLQQSFRKRQGSKNLWELPLAQDINFEAEKFDVYPGGSYLYLDQNVNLGDGVTLPNPSKGRVVGGFTETGSELDYAGYIDIDYVKKLVKGNKKFCEAIGLKDSYRNIMVYTQTMDDVENVLTTIKDQGYQAYSPMEYIKQMQEESKRQQAQWGAVGAIALIVSAIGIINTMLTSIMERKREIGVLKVLGCSLPSINAMFLIEAAVIGMLGGMIGVGLSYGVSALVRALPAASEGGSLLGSFFGGNVRFVIRPYVAAAAVLGAALIGMLAGIYPAMRAMRMSPLAALRDE